MVAATNDQISDEQAGSAATRHHDIVDGLDLVVDGHFATARPSSQPRPDCASTASAVSVVGVRTRPLEQHPVLADEIRTMVDEEEAGLLVP